MEWKIKYISKEDFISHVRKTIEKYGTKLEPFDIKRFNSNIIDPIKLIFDKTVYQSSWEEIVSKEIFRQRDKGNNNDIGYFHQGIFQYIKNCHVPQNGKEGGWDVIYTNPAGIKLPDGGIVHKIYVEMKNKHNTMNSASAGKTYIKMQHQLLNDDDCACFLVEAIAQRSQNIKWETTVDGRKVSHKNIRRVSLDKFYELVTGEEDAFFQMCMALPQIIKEVVESNGELTSSKDIVLEQLQNLANSLCGESEELSMAVAVYMLGFSTYTGFKNIMEDIPSEKEINLNRIYKYVEMNNLNQK